MRSPIGNHHVRVGLTCQLGYRWVDRWDQRAEVSDAALVGAWGELFDGLRGEAAAARFEPHAPDLVPSNEGASGHAVERRRPRQI